MAEINIEKMAQNVGKKAIQELRSRGVFISRWIPVSEGLPEIGTDVLACDMEGIIYLSHRTPHNNYFYAWGEKIKDILAWMPLPEPYKAESEDKE